MRMMMCERIITYTFDDWDKFKGLSQGSGRSEKVWLQSSDNKIGVFKYPKVDNEGCISSSEHVSEHLASVLGKKLGISVADVDIGFRNGRIGSMSYYVGSYIEEGINYISRRYPSFDSNTLYASEEDVYYGLQMIIESVGDYLPNEWYVPMIMFDYLIGNSDRHQSNWALQRIEGNRHRLCPLYDNGSSLCSFVREDSIDDILRDKLRFCAQTISKSKSCIRIDQGKKKNPTHEEVVTFLLEHCKMASDLGCRFVEILTSATISEMLSVYPDNVLSMKKKQLIERFLIAKVNRLELLMEERNG